MKVIQLGDMCHAGINIHRGLLKNKISSKILISSLINNYEKEPGVLFNKLHKFFLAKYIYTFYFVALNQADIFHCHGLSGIFPCILRKNFCIHFHGSDIRDFDKHPLLKKIIIRILCNSAKQVFVAGYDLIGKYVEYGFKPEKVEHIPNSVKLQKTFKKEFCKDGSISLFCPSSNHWTKRKDRLIRAFKTIEDEFENISLTLVRDESSAGRDLEKLIQKLSVKNINFIDRMSYKEFTAEYLKYDIVLDQFSDLKVYGVITYEALSYGMPAICTMGGNYNKSTIGSPVLPGNSVDIIIESVFQIINNNQFSKIGIQGRKFIEQNNSPKIIAAKFLKKYAEIR